MERCHYRLENLITCIGSRVGEWTITSLVVILVMVIKCHWRNCIRQGASIRIKHRIIRGLTRGRSQEKSGLLKQLSCSEGWNLKSRSLWSVFEGFNTGLNDTWFIYIKATFFSQYCASFQCSRIIKSRTLLFCRKVICCWRDSGLFVAMASSQASSSRFM